MTCDLRWPWRSQMVMYMNFTKNAFSKLVFELETSCKDQKNCMQYANRMVSFPRYYDELPVMWRHKCYFRKKLYNSFIFLAKGFKSKLKLFRASYWVITILKSSNFFAQIGKNVFKYGYHGYKNIDMLYLSNGAR